MGRGKLKLELMSNLKARCKYFEKRKRSVEKAAKDLSTLCGVDIAMVVYSSDVRAGTATTWSSNQQALAGLIASFKEKAAGPGKKTYTVSDCLKEEKKMESEEGKLVPRAMEEGEDRAGLDRTMEEEEDRAVLVAQSIGDVREGETSLNFAESSLSSSGPALDQSTWTYEQLSGANFDCYSDPMMMNYGGGGGDLDMSNGGGMCLNAEAPLLLAGSSEPFSLGSYDFDFVSSSEEFLDLDSCFSSSGGDQSSISAAANWFLNDEKQSGGGDCRFMMSPLVLAT